MKLTVIGGGGVRAPLFVTSVVRRSGRLGIDEVCLMDTDAEKLEFIAAVCQAVARETGSSIRITSTNDPNAAIEGARYIVTTIRVGSEEGRVLDERIALRHGVIGQETTGPGGFAMAMRNIPAILDYAELVQQVSPGAWIFNFTNPAGLVTQALHAAGFERVIGICDGANAAQYAIANWSGIETQRLHAEVFGLNHLSWTRRVTLDGKEILAPLLRDPAFLAGTKLRMFSPQLVESFGMWLNEYLYYYYYAECALEKITAEDKTRGEEIVELNQRLLNQLRTIDPEREPQLALRVYHAYNQRRHATYMYYAQPDAPTPEQADLQTYDGSASEAGSDGYAGVALDIIEGLETGSPVSIALNVPNEHAIPCMRPDDVVEVSCRVDRNGVAVLPIGDIPEPQEMLMRSVKLYERLTVKAIRTHSREIAVAALMAHPLVLSYSRATSLVDDYLLAHAPHIGTWK